MTKLVYPIFIGISQGLSKLVFTYIFARIFLPREFGELAIYLILVDFLSRFSNLGLGSSMIYDKERLSTEKMAAIFTVQLISGVVFGLVLLVGFVIMDHITNLSIKYDLVMISAGLIALKAFALTPFQVLQKKLDFKTYFFVDFAVNFILLIGITYSFARCDLGIISILYGQAICLICAFLLASFKVGFPKFTKGIYSEVAPLINFARGQVLYQFMNFFSMQADNLYVIKFLGENAMGLYGRAYQIISMPARLFSLAVGKYVFPYYSKKPNDLVRKEYQNIVPLLQFILCVFSFILVLNMEYIVRIFLGDNWLEIVTLAKVLCVGIIPRVTYNFSALILQSIGLTRDLGRAQLYFNIYFILLLVVLGGMYDLKGVGFAVVISMSIHSLVLEILIHRSTPLALQISYRTITVITLLAIVAILNSMGGVVMLWGYMSYVLYQRKNDLKELIANARL